MGEKKEIAQAVRIPLQDEEDSRGIDQLGSLCAVYSLLCNLRTRLQNLRPRPLRKWGKMRQKCPRKCLLRVHGQFCWRILRVSPPLPDVRGPEMPERRNLHCHFVRKPRSQVPVPLPDRLHSLFLRGCRLRKRLPKQPLQKRSHLHSSLQSHQLHLLMSNRLERCPL